MAVLVTDPEEVSSGSVSVPLSNFLSIGPSGDPAYLVISALDRNEYTVAATGATGSFTGNGQSLHLSAIGGDARGAGIVFTYQAATHQYVNATYGTLSQLDFVTSGSAGDVTNLSVFSATSLAQAQQLASNPYALQENDASGYIGSVSFVTDPSFSGTVPQAATPDSVAAVAEQFVGDAWNKNGCWVLASTIAAEAGASLPLASSLVDNAGSPNGEWFVLYNGPVSANANWENLVSTGDIVAFGTAGGGGHITTCVSGSGSTAMLIDNITYENQYGKITNPANDGSANDIQIAAAHAASQEWQGVSPSNVVIYALDTPVVTDIANKGSLSTGSTVTLASLLSAADPDGKSITQYQIYVSQNNDPLLLNGVTKSGYDSASNVLTFTSLSALSLEASNAGTDTIDIRAFNGSYWGDWTADQISITTPAPKPPVLAAQTAAQTWHQGKPVTLTLSASTFTDPQKETLTYSAALAGGGALPSWLSFNASTRAFTGTVPAGIESFAIQVTATDTSGLSTSETFNVSVPASAPVLAIQETAQMVAEGGTVDITLPAGSFTDPQNENLTYSARLSTGGALPSWLHFSASGLSFSGTAPQTAQTLSVLVTAADSSGLSASETFQIQIAKAAAGLTAADFLAPVFTTGPENAPSVAGSGAVTPDMADMAHWAVGFVHAHG